MEIETGWISVVFLLIKILHDVMFLAVSVQVGGFSFDFVNNLRLDWTGVREEEYYCQAIQPFYLSAPVGSKQC